MSGFIALGTSLLGRLGPARFRGAVFYVEEAGGAYGRRYADHEYPDRDIPYAEDLGRSQRVWTLTGYTIGPSYRLLRDALIRACERKGPGTLWHPAIGSVQAVCRRIQWTERREAGGHCAFQLEFAEPGELAQPSGAADTASLIEQAADALGAAMDVAFQAMFEVSNALSYVGDFATYDVQATAIILERSRMPASGYDQSAITEALASLYNEADNLVYVPPELSRRAAECFGYFGDAGEPYTAGIALLNIALDYLAGADYTDVVAPIAPFVPTAALASARAAPIKPVARAADPPGTEYLSSELVARNQGTWQRFVRENALREWGYLTPAMNFTSHADADIVLEKMTQAFDAAETAAADAGNDDVYIGLIDLRGACTADIIARRETLAPLVDYQMPRITNAVTMAWRFYHDANRDLELVDMVNAYTPAYMPIRGKIRAA